MEGLIMAGQLILALSIIVTLHEFGHFIAARAFGIRVEKFFLFFDAWGFKFFSFKKGDTEYGMGWLPLGGYVKISGMIDESMDREAMKQEPQDFEFRSKPAWQRLIVMLGGVIMNFILGIIILAYVTVHFEKSYLPVDSVTDGIYAYELGKDVGFETGDKIISVNGKALNRFEDLTSQSNLMGAHVVVLRDGKEVEIDIPEDFYKNYMKKDARPMFIQPDNFQFTVDSVLPEMAAAKAGVLAGDRILTVDSVNIESFGNFREKVAQSKGKEIELAVHRATDTLLLKVGVDSTGTIGIVTLNNPYEYHEYSIGDGLKYGWNDGISILTANVKGFGKILSGKEKATESLQGPIGIATIYGGTWDWHRFWFLTGMISLVLAFMNLLPIPALDGGHVVFLIIEMIIQRKLSDKFMERAQMVGMVLLLSLMVFVIGNDFWKYIIN